MTNKLPYIVRYSIYLLLIFTPLSRGAVQDWAVAGIHIITLIALAAFLMERGLTWNWEWIRTPFDRPFIALIILLIFSSVFSQSPLESIWAVTLFFNYLVIFYLTIHTFKTRDELRHLIYLVMGIAFFLAVFGLFKRLGINPFPWWEYTDIKHNPNMLSSTYGNHNHLAGYMEMAISMTLGLFLTGYRGGMLFLMIYIVFIMFVALVLSLSRGGWVGMLVGLSFMVFALFISRYFKRKRLIISMIGGFLALAFIVLASTPVVERIQTITEMDETAPISSRIMVWEGTARMILDYPLLGTGPGTFSTMFTQYQPPGLSSRFFMAHNDYLHFISEAGLIIIPLILWMGVGLFNNGFEKLKSPSRLVRGITLGAMTGVTAILVHSVSDFNLHIPANAILFTMLAAIIAAPLPENSR
jgi:O-antigen ligase